MFSWTDQCSFGHDTNNKIPQGGASGWVGQNFAYRGSTVYSDGKELDQLVEAWYNEVQCFNTNQVDPYDGTEPASCPANPNDKQIGHYTAFVWATTAKVGCGYIKYKNNQFYSQVTS